MNKDQIERLSAIGMIWSIEDSWENGFAHAEAYYDEKNHLAVPVSYVCDDGFALGTWINNQKNQYNNPQKYRELNDEQKKRLESIGMVWSVVREKWNSSYKLAVEYSKEHGNLQMRKNYKTAEGYNLGEWIAEQREMYRKGKLDADKAEKLDAIGMDWLSPGARLWETHFESCKKYYAEHGSLNIPLHYIDQNGFRLGSWLWRVRTGKLKLCTSGENGNQIARLEEIGIVWREDSDPKKTKSFAVESANSVGIVGGVIR